MKKKISLKEKNQILTIQLMHCNLEAQTNVGAPGNEGGLPLGA